MKVHPRRTTANLSGDDKYSFVSPPAQVEPFETANWNYVLLKRKLFTNMLSNLMS